MYFEHHELRNKSIEQQKQKSKANDSIQDVSLNFALSKINQSGISKQIEPSMAFMTEPSYQDDVQKQPHSNNL